MQRMAKHQSLGWGAASSLSALWYERTGSETYAVGQLWLVSIEAHRQDTGLSPQVVVVLSGSLLQCSFGLP